MKTYSPALVGALAALLVSPAVAQQTVIDWNPGALVTANTGFSLTPNEVIGPTERVNNYLNDVSPILTNGTGTYTGPDIFGVLQTGVPATDALTPAFNITFIHDSQSQARFGIRDADAADHASKNISTLLWLDDADFVNPVASVADLVSADIGAFLRGDGPSNEFSIHMAVLNGTQWYLSESRTTVTGINGGSQVETGLQVSDFASENWGAFTPATSSSNAFVSTAGLAFNTASSALNDVQGLGYYIQDLNDTIDPLSESRLYSRGFSYVVDAPPTEFVTDIAFTSTGALGGNGVRINNVAVPGATLTRNTGVDPVASNMSENESWTFTLGAVDLDDDGSADDSLSFTVSLASTFNGSPPRYLHERVNLSGGSNADYNGDDVVDSIDYAIWRENLGSSGDPGSVTGDGTGPEGDPDGMVDSLDFELWRDDYGSALSTQPGGGFTVEEPGVADGEGDLGEGETLQFVASNLTYSIDGGAAQTDGSIDGFRLVDFAQVINQDNVDINGSTFNFAGSTVINLGENATNDVTVQWAANTLPIDGTTKTQGYSVEGLTLRVTIPAAGAGAIATPEPMAAGLLVLGLGGAALRRRRSE